MKKRKQYFVEYTNKYSWITAIVSIILGGGVTSLIFTFAGMAEFHIRSVQALIYFIFVIIFSFLFIHKLEPIIQQVFNKEKDLGGIKYGK